MTALPLSLRLYRSATSGLEPMVPLVLRRRVGAGKEDPNRLRERLGFASRARPDGELVWIHGASVGECLSVLPLIDALLRKEGRTVLLTSGTVTSASLMADRLPARALHQFVPIDTPSAVSRFLAHWRPDTALFVDSEIWPNMLMAAHARRIPLGLVNGRMSERSYARWQRAKRMARSLLSLYDICLVQDDETAARMRALGAARVEMCGSLKADAPPLPADPQKLSSLEAAIAKRPVFFAASTHEGEEEILCAAHDSLRHRFANLLTIIAPRHPERGAEIQSLWEPRRARRRSLGEPPAGDAEIYIADTIGELGLFFRIATFAFMGGSLVPHGGQNPLEPARLGVAVIAGPSTDNFRPAYDAIWAAQGAGRIHDASEIEALAAMFLGDPATARRLGESARRAILALGGAVERTRVAIEALLRRHAST